MHTGWLPHVRGEAARGAPSPAEQMWLAFVQHLRRVCPHVSNSAAFVQWEPHRGCSGGGQQPADYMLGLSVSNPAHTLLCMLVSFWWRTMLFLPHILQDPEALFLMTSVQLQHGTQLHC